MMPLFVLIASFVPNFIWLALYVREDPHPEPRPMLWLSFFLGIGGTGVALALEYGILHLVHVLTAIDPIVIYNSVWYIFLVVALVEELVKFFVIRFVVARSPAFDEPIDAMIYVIVGALGFAFAENVLIVGNALLPAAASMTDIVRTIVFRFVGANFLHLTTTGIAGYFWARGLLERKEWRFIGRGLIVAIFIHGSFNFIMLTFGPLAFMASLIFVFLFGLYAMRDLELLRQLSVRRELFVYYPEKRNP